MLMPARLIERFNEVPRHYRWLIVSIIASAVLLWLFLRIVVGGLNAYIEAQIPRGYEALYLPYNLEERPLPTLPETLDDSMQFFVLPEVIAEHYRLEIPLSEEEAEAIRAAELEAFLALSTPVETALLGLQTSLAETLEAQAAAAAAVTPQEDVEAAAAAEPTAAESIAAEPTPAPQPTVNPVQLQATAVNIAAAELSTLHEVLLAAQSIQPVYETLPALQAALNGVSAAGISLPEAEPFSTRLAELAAAEAPVVYQISDCLASSRMITRRGDVTTPPCTIDTTATFVEQGRYLYGDLPFHVVAAEYPSHEQATNAVKQIFQYARTIGRIGNFSLGPIVYDYAFSSADGLYTLTWSHDTWVFSITAENAEALENLVTIFPY